ncbi:PE-PPE domain-containing protein [Gordonia sp. ABSL49_1]|uniref:PE-PPE domain-containing protein n=1 Tax=Gordonia sp. ABSL49_1 TaxID=2920941 RepID=UPI001F0F52DF|nr:PE-PPE domain-containing protein [Gordonia sp. ABSL49_1]MCH5641076.1 PE-PPE domain-containing protein [Gordonia sp. ABSL49_1]
MRRIFWLFAVLTTVGAVFLIPNPSAHALQIGSIVFPDFDPPVTIDQSKPTTVAEPEWVALQIGRNFDSGKGDVVILIPGTTDYDGTDQLGRTRDIGMFGTDPDTQPPVQVVDYPAAFGLTIGPLPIYLAGEGTFNESVDIGTRKGVAAAEAAYDPDNPDQIIVINGYSQSSPVAMNVAYMLKERGTIPTDQIVVIVGADSRFPHSGVENVVPSFIPGMYTNGDRDTDDMEGIKVISYCVRGDATCGVGNPFTNPIGTFFYLIPGFYVHAFLTYRINEYEVIDTWSSQAPDRGCGCGNTTYVVYDGGNPWEMMLRDLGIPIPTEVDDILSAIIPVPMPGEQSTIAGVPVPTPRELQDSIYEALGLTVTVTDPDVNKTVRDDMLVDDTQDDSKTATPATTANTATARGLAERVDTTANDEGADNNSADDDDGAAGEKKDDKKYGNAEADNGDDDANDDDSVADDDTTDHDATTTGDDAASHNGAPSGAGHENNSDSAHSESED